MKRINNIWFSGVMTIMSLYYTALAGQTDTICFNDTILYEIPGAKNSEYNWKISGGSIIYFSKNNKNTWIIAEKCKR